MFDAMFSWFLLIGIVCGAFSLLTLIGDFLPRRSTRIEVYIHPTRKVKDITRIIEMNGEMFIFRETEEVKTHNTI